MKPPAPQSITFPFWEFLGQDTIKEIITHRLFHKILDREDRGG